MTLPWWWWLLLLLTLLSYFWPIRYRLTISVRKDQEGPQHQLLFRAVGLWGQLRVLSLRRPPAHDELVLEVRLLHLLPLRKELPALKGGVNASGPYVDTLEEWELGRHDEGGEKARRHTLAELRDLWARWRPVWRALRAGSRFWWRHLWVDEARLDAALGLADAAHTAQAYGWLWGTLGTVWSWAEGHLRFRQQPRIRLRPVFDGHLLQLEFLGQAHIRQGEAVLALLLSVATYLRLKLAAWRRQLAVGRASRTPAA